MSTPPAPLTPWHSSCAKLAKMTHREPQIGTLLNCNALTLYPQDLPSEARPKVSRGFVRDPSEIGAARIAHAAATQSSEGARDEPRCLRDTDGSRIASRSGACDAEWPRAGGVAKERVGA